MFLGETQKQEILRELNLLSLISGEYPVLSNDYYPNIDSIIADIEENGVESKYILLTDVDNQQIAIKVTDDIWIYSEQDCFEYSCHKHNDIDVEEYITEKINFKDYTLEEIENAVKGYESSLEAHKKIYGDDWKQIALECIFEQRLCKGPGGSQKIYSGDWKQIALEQ